MNSMRLMLTSAAALVAAVSSARAADAIVAVEPEPMEYVRVCDTYGVGFYYIPGTETCLKVSGYIRMDIGAGAFGLTGVTDKQDDSPWWQDPQLNDTYDLRTRFQLRMDARSETELGTLRAYAAVNFDYDTDAVRTDRYFNDDDFFTDTADYVSIEHAYIELAGFRVGKTDSLFSTFTGYGGGVINDDIIGYGPYGTHQIAYGWSNDSGFGAAVALEFGAGDLIAPFLPPPLAEIDLYALDSYVPHVVAGVGWHGAWGGVSVVAGYDSVWEQGAIKGRVDFYPTDRLALFAMAGWATYDKDRSSVEYFDFDDFTFRTVDTKDSPNYYAPWGRSWAVWAGGSYMLTDKATFNLQVSYDQMEDFAVVANVAYELVPNFVVTPEIAYIDNFDDDFSDWYDAATDGGDLISKNWGFFVRAQANFGG
ncbi:porin [Mesorhizobium sp. ZMM04-5]|uniref:Porin n=1 Tax=Mesorhizobium marinum TaxID=3228790 RepID=A0ABV3QXY5_9HYPH